MNDEPELYIPCSGAIKIEDRVLCAVRHGRHLWDFRIGQFRIYWGPWYPILPGLTVPVPGPIWRYLQFSARVAIEKAVPDGL